MELLSSEGRKMQGGTKAQFPFDGRKCSRIAFLPGDFLRSNGQSYYQLEFQAYAELL